MTLQPPELWPLRCEKRRAIKAHSVLLQSFASSQKAITGCSCKHFAPRHSWDTQSKRTAAISLFHRGSPCEYTLQAEYSEKGKIHRIVQGAELGHKTHHSKGNVYWKRCSRIPLVSVVDVQHSCNVFVYEEATSCLYSFLKGTQRHKMSNPIESWVRSAISVGFV